LSQPGSVINYIGEFKFLRTSSCPSLALLFAVYGDPGHG
jgi:hypothetical protein